MHDTSIYRIRGLFGGDFNLAVWQIISESPNLSRAILKVIFKIKPVTIYAYSSLAKAYYM